MDAHFNRTNEITNMTKIITPSTPLILEPDTEIISSRIFNLNKDDYRTGSLFFNTNAGLFDTINDHYPALTRLYKKLKSLDWDEVEFNFETCRPEMTRMERDRPGSTVPMTRQIGFQYETDSVAARTVAPIMSGFLTNDSAFKLYQRIGDNEVVHGSTYAEIVRYSYADPDKAMRDVIELKGNATRLSVVSKVFDKAFETSHKLALGQLERNQETFNVFFLYVVALFMMERLQFMSSFAVTFSYASGDISYLMPICKAVQKICQDEYEIHSLAGALMIDSLWDTSEGLTAFIQQRGIIQQMFNEVLEQESIYIETVLLPEGVDSCNGVTKRDLQAWKNYCGKDVADLLNLDMPEAAPKMNPLSFMKTWVNISSIQASLQEEKNGAYLLGMVRRDDMDHQFNTAGL